MRHPPGNRDTSLEMEQNRQWRNSWHDRWNAHAPVAADTVDANVRSSSIPIDKASGSKSSPNGSMAQEHIKANEELLTYDNATLGKPTASQDSLQRARMESEVSIRRESQAILPDSCQTFGTCSSIGYCIRRRKDRSPRRSPGGSQIRKLQLR
jgi:hypothetical protein